MGSIGVEGSSAFARGALEPSITPTRAIATNALGNPVTLGAVLHITEGVGCIGDPEGGNDGSGGDDDVFFHIFVSLVFGYFPVHPVVSGYITTCRLADWAAVVAHPREVAKANDPCTSLIRRLLENLPRNLKLFFRGWRNQSWAFRFLLSGLGSGQPFASR
jgi:hypothetical protein